MAKKKTPDIYRIVDTRTHEPVETGFATREAAKPKRNEMNAAKGNEGRYIVSRGENHPLGPSNGISKRLRGKNSRW